MRNDYSTSWSPDHITHKGHDDFVDGQFTWTDQYANRWCLLLVDIPSYFLQVAATHNLLNLRWWSIGWSNFVFLFFFSQKSIGLKVYVAYREYVWPVEEDSMIKLSQQVCRRPMVTHRSPWPPETDLPAPWQWSPPTLGPNVMIVSIRRLQATGSSPSLGPGLRRHPIVRFLTFQVDCCRVRDLAKLVFCLALLLATSFPSRMLPPILRWKTSPFAEALPISGATCRFPADMAACHSTIKFVKCWLLYHWLRCHAARWFKLRRDCGKVAILDTLCVWWIMMLISWFRSSSSESASKTSPSVTSSSVHVLHHSQAVCMFDTSHNLLMFVVKSKVKFPSTFSSSKNVTSMSHVYNCSTF